MAVESRVDRHYRCGINFSRVTAVYARRGSDLRTRLLKHAEKVLCDAQADNVESVRKVFHTGLPFRWTRKRRPRSE